MNIYEFNNTVIKKLCLVYYKLLFIIVSFFESIYLRLIGVSLGHNIQFRGWVNCYKSKNSKIEIGSNCRFNCKSFSNHIGLNHRCIISTMRSNASIIIGKGTGMSSTTITSFNHITIGCNVKIGANCVIMDGDFHLDDPRSGTPQPVIIGDNVWLGYGVIVKKGVTIGRNSVIGVNSVVTKDIPENVVAAGTPARVISYIENLYV